MSKTIRVACVGDSITEVSGYPTYLQTELGSKYIVGNFGVCGSTALRGVYSSYIDQIEFIKAKEFTSDIVILMLGTNDASPDFYQSIGFFQADYKELIKEFLNQEFKPEIWLAKPPPIINNSFELYNENLVKGIIPCIEKVAKEIGLPIIDVYAALENHREYFFEDGVHPNLKGAKVIAQEVKKAITFRKKVQ